MIVFGWLFIGAVGLYSLGKTVDTTQDELAIVWGLIGMGSWALWAWQSLTVEVVKASGGSIVTETYNYPQLTMFGFAVALIPLYIVLTGPIALIPKAVRDGPKTEGVQR